MKQQSIVTVTLNPVIDQTVLVRGFERAAVNRAEHLEQQAGGKGINVATMLSLGGDAVHLTGFLGAANRAIFDAHFERHRMPASFIELDGPTRIGIKVVDVERTETTDLNLPGLRPSPEACTRLLDELRGLAEADRWFVFSGSLPTGMETRVFVDALALLKAAGARIAVDSSGEGLRLAVEAGVDLIKPNDEEFAELSGCDPESPDSILEAARALNTRVATLVISLGKRGAYFITPQQAVHAQARPERLASTVGAGDSLLAGTLSGLVNGTDLGDTAARATTYACCRLESLEPRLPAAADLQRRIKAVEVRSLED